MTKDRDFILIDTRSETMLWGGDSLEDAEEFVQLQTGSRDEDRDDHDDRDDRDDRGFWD